MHIRWMVKKKREKKWDFVMMLSVTSYSSTSQKVCFYIFILTINHNFKYPSSILDYFYRQIVLVLVSLQEEKWVDSFIWMMEILHLDFPLVGLSIMNNIWFCITMKERRHTILSSLIYYKKTNYSTFMFHCKYSRSCKSTLLN